MSLTEQATAAMKRAQNGGEIIPTGEWFMVLALCQIADTMKEKNTDDR